MPTVGGITGVLGSDPNPPPFSSPFTLNPNGRISMPPSSPSAQMRVVFVEKAALLPSELHFFSSYHFVLMVNKKELLSVQK